MRAAVVIPIYKPRRADLEWYELISLKRCIEVLGHHPIIFMAPEGREFDYLPSEIDYTVERFNQKYFADRNGYNVLMINPKFYKRFRAFDYILIHQLDAFVFSDRLEEFCRAGYDYIGAPWPLGIGRKANAYLNVGNGGFSLRRVQACIDVLKRHAKFFQSTQLQEDSALSYIGKMKPETFKVAPLRTAIKFSFEILPERYYCKNENALPFGCHAYNKYDSNFYVQLFAECGYDLTPYRHMMDDLDRRGQNLLLNSFLEYRLLRRLQRHDSLIRYLSSGEEFFVILADRQSIDLLNRLRAEGLRMINEDRVPIAVNEKILQAVSSILTKISRRGLLLSMTDDTSTVAKLIDTRGGGDTRYGTKFISFWQEYKRHSTELIRRMP